MANIPTATPDPSLTAGAAAITNSLLDAQSAALEELFSQATQQTFRAAGTGSYLQQYQTLLSQFDRFGINAMLPNHEVVGFTFITRPKLNFSTTSLRQDRILMMLDTPDPGTLQFAMRCYLDTYYSSRSDVLQVAAKCPFFNSQSPFLIPLSNNLLSVSGWPDPVIETETTDGGFFSEDMTMAKGSDRLNKTYDITLTFRDIQGGFIISMLWMWIHYIELVVRGDTTAYPEDIAARRINYTCSIYRFVMDPSRQFITKWSKATGCFPRSVPIGNIFNFGERENFIKSAEQYSVPFTVNKVEIMDPIIFRDFNTIVKRYYPFAGNPTSVIAGMQAQDNFMGIPYIDTLGGFNKLNFLLDPGTTVTDPFMETLKQLNTAYLATQA